ncbi:HVA22-like protein k isoform X2 [Beta vulgaris subsp. vulgaris]|uniref:HVA22-like protein k isoform X2 n=1 Tax=Beta vulgaris subsp. vulgaris TaxID=3555 RepID=UPI0025495638|nr:HVA22-like protein k isoform X2 [Beta vulgaris subsp. vulgaris]
MAFAGSNYPLEVGLRLLLSPPGSNVIVRTACCSVGVILPVYTTFKAIERKDPDEQQKCLVYWAAYGSFTVAEMITDKLIYWFPLYYHMKFAFLVWLQLPSTEGATQLYMNHMRPFLLRHQAKLDYIAGFLYSEMQIRCSEEFCTPAVGVVIMLLLKVQPNKKKKRIRLLSMKINYCFDAV